MRPVLWVLVFLTAVFGCSAPVAPPPKGPVEVAPVDDTSPIGRLDDRVVPKQYDLEWSIDDGDNFTGRVAIDVEIGRPVSTIWLHARALDIGEAKVTQKGRTVAAKVVTDPRTDHREGQSDLVGIATPAPLQKGQAKVELAFRGAYAARVGLIAARSESLVFTDFEPNDARAAVPCFDDPRFKTPWTIHLNVPAGVEAISNYPRVSSDTLPNGRSRVHFAPTRPIATYQVAAAVGKWEAAEARFGSVPIRILTSPGRAELGKYAASLTPRMLAALEKYFDEPMPYPKLDIVAIPTLEGHTGGMENPGLITLRAELLLVPQDGSRRMKAGAAEPLAHELAHLWIGDLVTIHRWEDLWLQEGGASLFGMNLARELGENDGAGPFAVGTILRRERLGSRASVTDSVEKPGDANALFRIETYAGGAAVYAALEAYLGKDGFRRAFARWIDARRDGSIGLDDLVDALAHEDPHKAGAPALRTSIEGMIASHTSPTVTAAARCDGPKPAIELSSDAAYPVPVCVRFDACIAAPGSDAPACRRCALVDGKARLDVDTCPKAILPNPGGEGLYHADWAPGGIAALVTSTALDERDLEYVTEELVRKLDALPFRERASAAAFLSLRSKNPMNAARGTDTLELLLRAAPDEASRAKLIADVKAVFRGEAPAFTTSDGRSTTAGDIARLLAQYGDADARTKAQAVESTDLFVLNDVWAARASAGDEKFYSFLRDKALDQKDGSGTTAAMALGAFNSKDGATKIRSLLKDKKLTDHRAATLIEAAMSNPLWFGRALELASIRPSLGEKLIRAADHLCDEAELERVVAALPALKDKDLSQTRKTVGTCAKLRAAWK
ncbi:MAG: hypothetical protein HOW73_16695 [Polyangiaceae bacterium]|nr:hypothetical protein [Polyangiaceae bacterium]